MRTGPLFPKIRECKKKIIILQGGGDSAKTTTALQYFAVDSIETPNILTTVTAQDIPNLKGGALRTFQKYVVPDIDGYISDYNKTDRIYTLKNKSVIEFKSFEDEQDARGSERDNLFMNEVNTNTYQMFWQLQRKTRRKIIVDYNPSAPFFIHERILSGKEKQFRDIHQLYITDHRHNPFLSQEEHDAYENISDPDLFRVYSRGLTGKVRGLIFGHFQKCTWDDVPKEKNGTRRADGSIVTDGYDKIMWGGDYGYSNDETAFMKILVQGRKRWCKEVCYETGLSAEQIKDILYLNGYQEGEIIYSEVDPNMINQLRIFGFPVIPAIKGPGAEIARISKVKEHECYYFDSPNFEKELMHYKWVTAQDIRTGKEILTNQATKGWDHLCDAFAYADYTDSFQNR